MGVTEMLRRIATLMLCSLLAAAAAEASSAGFVYVAVTAAPCAQASPCAPPQLLVLDAATTALVTTLDLPVHTTPRGMALSPDGAHLYVSNAGAELGAATSMTVIDARHHTLTATYPLGAGDWGRLAVGRDDSRVYLMLNAPEFATESVVEAFDTATHTITASATLSVGAVSIAASRSADRIFVYGRHRTPQLDDSKIVALDPISLAEIQSETFNALPIGLSLSRDEKRLYALVNMVPYAGTVCQTSRIVDAATLAIISTYGAYRDTDGGCVDLSGNPAEAPRVNQLAILAGPLSLQNGRISAWPDLQGVATDVTVPPLQRLVFLTTRQSGTTARSVVAVDLDTNTVVTKRPLTGDAGALASTPEGAASCTYRLDTTQAAFSRFGQGPSRSSSAGIAVRVNTDCAWMASTGAAWLHLSTAAGTGNGTVTLTADTNNSVTRQATVSIGGQIVTVTQSGVDAQPPFGVIDTPADGSTVSGSVAVTGWALDNAGVDEVQIYRDPLPSEPPIQMPVGFATFVDGARPDVRAAYPTLPFASRAGWGYMLLTNMLPGGDGTYRLYAYARDLDGNRQQIGFRSLTVRNGTATLPFGAIDTPSSGETVSGTIVNWGWALTPQPASIPVNGSTIDVVVDNVVIGHPAFGLDRSDIAALFPGYANTHSAVGYLTIDTTTMTNGLHTLAWVVRDSLAGAQGIGSRFFTVQNP